MSWLWRPLVGPLMLLAASLCIALDLWGVAGLALLAGTLETKAFLEGRK